MESRMERISFVLPQAQALFYVVLLSLQLIEVQHTRLWNVAIEWIDTTGRSMYNVQWSDGMSKSVIG